MSQPPHPLPEKPKNREATQPTIPPEIQDAEATRAQTVDDRTRDIAPIKDVRLHSSPVTPAKSKRVVPAQLAPETARRSSGQSPLRLPIWSVLLMLMMVCGAVGCAVLAVYSLGGRTIPATSAPQFIITTAEPSLTPVVSIPVLLASPTLPPEFAQSSEAQSLMLAGPTLEPIIYTATPTPAPEIAVGSTVIVIGDQGINIRNNPGTGNAVLAVADPGDLFTITGGPQQSNGLTWWQISDPTRGINGWAADNDGTTDLLQVISP